MCNGKASIFYGLFVKSASLGVAARAWKKVEPALRAVELIKARRIKGTLQLTKDIRAGFTTLPNEIIESVVEQVVASTWVEAENSFVRDFHGWRKCYCLECEDYYSEEIEVLLSSFGLRLPSFVPVIFEEFPPISSLVSPLTSFSPNLLRPHLEPHVEQRTNYDCPETAHAFTSLDLAPEAHPAGLCALPQTPPSSSHRNGTPGRPQG
ncbi:hypothetical protein JCM8547_002288 [Rhodosporidiobolus lusitaniae]